MLRTSVAQWQCQAWAVLVLLASLPTFRRLGPEPERPAPPAPKGPSVREIVADTVSELEALRGGGAPPPPGGECSSELGPQENGSRAEAAECVCECPECEAPGSQWLGWLLGGVSVLLQLRGWWQGRGLDGASSKERSPEDGDGRRRHRRGHIA
ncbi:unnamed protein product [Prorocentrum cordatum]|uniref:Uncharacterized protein n=1 Tax=Prorocentrum cordatum TaxID=2364126 RepID=A0ABN9XVB9_9DINO|nr:unnamed protein product [Polarella glacialis]